jgi:hypothetical protein
VWIARAAIEVGDIVRAEATANELLALNVALRQAHGDALEWTEQREELWDRALEATGSRKQASRVVSDISTHAYQKHWAHTTLGLVALRRGDTSEAVKHLRSSSEVRDEPRLSSYGPSFQLAEELCRLGEWSAVTDFLRECERFWDVEVLRALRNDVEQCRVPDFPSP